MKDSVEAYRHVPYDIEVEQALLGTLLVDNSKIDLACEDLELDHFYDPLHQRLFEMISALATEGQVTPLIVNSCMKSDPGLQEVGGHAYLAGLAQAAPAYANIRDYARIIIELAQRRDLIRVGEDLVNAAYEKPIERPAQAIADGATEALLGIGLAQARPMLSPYAAAMESLKRAEDIAMGKPVPMVKTGLGKLDDELGGIRGGDLIVVMAKSGQGKSAFLGSVCLNTARAGVPTIMFSLEMTQSQLVERMVCDLDFDTADKPMWYSRVRNGRLSEEEFSRFGRAATVLDGLPLEISDHDDLTIQQIASRARAFKAKHRNAPLGIVAIDYAQIVSPTDPRGQNREQQVAGIARGAKSLAKRLGWPVIMGSQVNEGDQGRSKDEKRPQLGDTRESKAVGNEADLALSPYRPAYFVENRRPADALPGDAAWIAWRGELSACINRMDLICLKNRHGRRFEVELFCDMGASAIRDSKPYQPTEADRNAADLLTYT